MNTEKNESKTTPTKVRVCFAEKCKHNRFRYGEAACNFKEIEIIDGKCFNYERIEEGVDV